jgi:hypothetical protein
VWLSPFFSISNPVYVSSQLTPFSLTGTTDSRVALGSYQEPSSASTPEPSSRAFPPLPPPLGMIRQTCAASVVARPPSPFRSAGGARHFSLAGGAVLGKGRGSVAQRSSGRGLTTATWRSLSAACSRSSYEDHGWCGSPIPRLIWVFAQVQWGLE